MASFDDSERISSSQNTAAVSRQGSSTSSYFDSQDSAAVGEISLNKTATKRKTKGLPECNQRVIIAPGESLRTVSFMWAYHGWDVG